MKNHTTFFLYSFFDALSTLSQIQIINKNKAQFTCIRLIDDYKNTANFVTSFFAISEGLTLVNIRDTKK